jgi:prophage tail gpP-like protein
MSDELTITVTPANGGQALALTGWTSTRVTRGIERCPSDFQISATERNPLDPGVLQVFPGDQAVVSLGADVVLSRRNHGEGNRRQRRGHRADGGNAKSQDHL